MTGILHVYSRVSSQTQAEKGWSLANQKEFGQKVADAHGLKAKFWDEGGASSHDLDSIDELPVLKSMLIELGLNTSEENQFVYTYAADRLGRDPVTGPYVINALRKYNCVVYYGSGTNNVYDLASSQDRFILGIMQLIGSHENDVKVERVRQGKRKRAASGMWSGGLPPFGYDVENGFLIVNEEESSWVKQVYDWYLGGMSIAKIVRSLLQNGVMTKHGKPVWSNGSIEKILFQNTVYKGYRTVGDHTHNNPRIMSDEEWEAPKLKRPKRSYSNANQLKKISQEYLFNEWAVCGDCGHKLRVRNKLDTKRTRVIGKSYYCAWKEGTPNLIDDDLWKRQRSGYQCSMRKSLDGDQFEDVVFDKIVQVLYESRSFEKHLKGVLNNDKSSKANRLKKINTQLRTLKTNIQNYDFGLSSLEADVYSRKKTESEASGPKDELNKRKNNDLGKINELLKEKDLLESSEKTIDWFKTFSEELEVIRYGSIEEKKSFLDPVIDTVKVHLEEDKKSHRIEVKFKPGMFDKRVFAGSGFNKNNDEPKSGEIVEVVVKKNSRRPKN